MQERGELQQLAPPHRDTSHGIAGFRRSDLDAARRRTRDRGNRSALADVERAPMASMTHDEMARYLRSERPEVLETIARVRHERQTFLSERKLIELAGETALLAERGIPGAVVEAGCALGGSALVLAAAKEPDRPLYVYDLFGMIPWPGLFDGWKAWRLSVLNRLGLRKAHGGDRYYGYEPDLLGRMLRRFRDFGLDPDRVRLTAVKGRHEVTLAQPPPFAVALAHVDSDWFRSVEAGVRALAPALAVGGRIVLDDYYSFPGCRRAVDAYFAGGRGGRFELVGAPERKALHAVRTQAEA
jgi:asparagine synthase (glutamine-hydrolysing)